jgi:hypothetical protein
MSQDTFHISDQDLLLLSDGELSPWRAAWIRRHLAACWTCRTRLAQRKQAMADVVDVYRRELDSRVTPVDRPRALLRARLLENRPEPRRYATAALVAALAFTTLAAVVVGAGHGRAARLRPMPDFHLTPGAALPARIEDVCSSEAPPNDPAVPDTLRRQVLQAYGLNGVSSDAYQIDYLVTPQLGGAADVRNLWPQPAFHTMWNARAKDALENRLHEMVCSRQLDLQTAQREISHDWIAAYKKYFHTGAPQL